jgi:Domain of unknown function (DUF1127).
MLQKLKLLFQRMIEARQREADARIAALQLHRCTDRELNDMGITRCDIERVVRSLP